MKNKTLLECFDWILMETDGFIKNNTSRLLKKIKFLSQEDSESLILLMYDWIKINVMSQTTDYSLLVKRITHELSGYLDKLPLGEQISIIRAGLEKKQLRNQEHMSLYQEILTQDEGSVALSFLRIIEKKIDKDNDLHHYLLEWLNVVNPLLIEKIIAKSDKEYVVSQRIYAIVENHCLKKEIPMIPGRMRVRI